MYGHVISPDGKFIAYFFRPPELDSALQLEIVPVEGGAVAKILPGVGDGSQVRWSPDGKSIDYVETREGIGNLWRRPIDGGQARRLSDWQQALIFRFAWSRDGKQLACARGMRATDVVLIENLDLNE